MLSALKAGVSGRKQSTLHDSGGKSTVSRLWAKEGEKVLASFRARAIDRADWLVLGATENSETAKNLLARLSKRGFAPAKECRLLCVLDGSPALETAVQAYYPESVFQRCLVHKERNLRRYLHKSEQPELTQREG